MASLRQRVDHPTDLDSSGWFTPSAVEFRSERTHLPWESRDFKKLGLDETQRDRYLAFLDAVEQENTAPIHRVLGHPESVQGDMQLECQLVTHGLYCGDASGYEDPRAASLASGAGEWLLLFQLDSDDNTSMIWGDCGRLFFWITKESLSAARFERSWMILQCS